MIPFFTGLIEVERHGLFHWEARTRITQHAWVTVHARFRITARNKLMRLLIAQGRMSP